MPGFERQLSYDSIGNISEETQWINGTPKTVWRQYDMYGRPKEIRIGLHTLDYQYRYGMLVAISDQGQPILSFSGENMSGSPTNLTVASIARIVQRFSQPGDPLCSSNQSQLCQIQLFNSTNGIVFSERYFRDKVGRIIGISGDREVTIIRDEAGRVVAVLNGHLKGSPPALPIALNIRMKELKSLSKALGANKYSELFTFDQRGRISWSSRSGSYVYPSLHQAHLDAPD